MRGSFEPLRAQREGLHEAKSNYFWRIGEMPILQKKLPSAFSLPTGRQVRLRGEWGLSLHVNDMKYVDP